MRQSGRTHCRSAVGARLAADKLEAKLAERPYTKGRCAAATEVGMYVCGGDVTDRRRKNYEQCASWCRADCGSRNEVSGRVKRRGLDQGTAVASCTKYRERRRGV